MSYSILFTTLDTSKYTSHHICFFSCIISFFLSIRHSKPNPYLCPLARPTKSDHDPSWTSGLPLDKRIQALPELHIHLTHVS